MMRRPTSAANVGGALAGVIFGGAVVATRVAGREVPPLSLAVMRYALGGILLLLALLAGARRLPRVRRRDFPLLASLGIILFAAFPLAFNAGLRFTEASRGSLMLATTPFWSALLARAARRERLRPRQVGGLALTFAGVALLLAERGLHWQANARALAGDGLLLVAAVCAALYGVLAKPALARYSALTVTTYAMVVGALALTPAALVEGLLPALGRLTGRTLALTLFLGAVGGALGWYLWSFALSRLTPTQGAVYVNLNPMAATALGAVFLGERLTEVFVIGFIAVLIGVLLVNLPLRRVAPAPGVAMRPTT
jgi:drug/metabolite transporter (DMT)-like permease